MRLKDICFVCNSMGLYTPDQKKAGTSQKSNNYTQAYNRYKQGPILYIQVGRRPPHLAESYFRRAVHVRRKRKWETRKRKKKGNTIQLYCCLEAIFIPCCLSTTHNIKDRRNKRDRIMDNGSLGGLHRARGGRRSHSLHPYLYMGALLYRNTHTHIHIAHRWREQEKKGKKKKRVLKKRINDLFVTPPTLTSLTPVVTVFQHLFIGAGSARARLRCQSLPRPLDARRSINLERKEKQTDRQKNRGQLHVYV